MTEKSEFREMRSFDLAIHRAYFKAQIRRNYAKNVVINRSVNTKDLRNPGSYLQSLVYKANGLTKAPRWLLNDTKFYVISTESR